MPVATLLPPGDSSGSPSRNLGDNLRRLIRAESLCTSTLEIPRRHIVYSCMDSDRCIYLVERGQVKAVVPSRDGKDCLLGIYTAGDVFGESCLLGGYRVESVTTMTDTVLRRISAARVLAALADADLREEFIKYLARRVFEQQRLITDLITADSEYRLAAILLHLARKLGKRDAHLLRIEGRITQEELSGMVGTTRSRVGFFLKRFCDAGLVSRAKDCFLVIDEPLLDGFLTGEAVPARSLPAAQSRLAQSGLAQSPLAQSPLAQSRMAQYHLAAS
jgi:CRP/FNR family cyclic AMP-dependent transcriptional regulator